jgi:hypothetical protein
MIIQMHYMIWWIMQLTFKVNMILAVALFINPIYWIHLYVSPSRIGRIFDFLQRFPKLFGTTQEDSPSPEMNNVPDNQGIIATARQIWRKCPFKLIILIIILSLYLQEFFPFSHWPMYASPNPESTYMQIQDAMGDPLMPAKEYVRLSLGSVYKYYRATCKSFWGHSWKYQMKKELKCGNATLNTVMKYTLYRKLKEVEQRLPLQLVEIMLRMEENNKISRNVRIVGYLEKLPVS